MGIASVGDRRPTIARTSGGRIENGWVWTREPSSPGGP